MNPAAKQKTPCRKLTTRYQAPSKDEERACLQVVAELDRGKSPLVARFGGIPLKRNWQAVLTDY